MVRVEVNFTDPSTAEYSAAQQLKRLFEEQTSDTETGSVLIFPNVTLYGQRVRQLDLVVIAQFGSGFSRKLLAKADVNGTREEAKWRDVYIGNLCWCVEVKDHDPDGVQFQGSTAMVRYNSRTGPLEWKDASKQSDDQLYALRGHFTEQLGQSPYVVNLLWFRNLGKEDIARLPLGHNYVTGEDNLSVWFTRALLIHPPQQRKNQHGRPYFASSCTAELDESAIHRLQRAIRHFQEVRETLGSLSRSKLEKITRTAILQNQAYANAIGEKLVVIRGRAGTGKTIKLLHIAHDLCTHKDKRCLILTYNKALASDIRRLIALANISDDITEPTIEVNTVHAFMRALMIGFGVYDTAERKALQDFEADWQAQLATNHVKREDHTSAQEAFVERFFIDHYDALKTELLSYLRNGLISQQDVRDLLKQEHDTIDWDMLLIDESQDWPEDERAILYAIFEPKRFVIADGVDQLVRQSTHSNWLKDIDHHRPIISEKRSLRQKNNLCRFLSAYTEAVNKPWDIEPQEDLRGGKIIISTKPYTQALHQRLMQAVSAAGNQPYEMMFLAPPNLVCKSPRRFALTEEWQSWGIALWDGTSPDLRSEYPTKVEQHRVLQYDSCRGLEGWTVVCLNFDRFVQYKREQAEPNLPTQRRQLQLESAEEQRNRQAQNWALIALTRAIDTLVLTIEDPKSDTAQTLRQIANTKPDFVEWID